jgi:outer membrane receptor protein involved in Fe transport
MIGYALQAQTSGDSLLRSKQVSDSLIRSLRGYSDKPAKAIVTNPGTMSTIGSSGDSGVSHISSLPQRSDSIRKTGSWPGSGAIADSTIRQSKWQANPQGGYKPSGDAPQSRPGGPPAGMTGGPPSGMPSGMGGGFSKMPIGHIYGKVIDAQNKKPVSYCSVSVFTMRDSLITGQLTEDNGDFSFTELPFGPYNVKVSFLGYKAITSKVILTPQKTDQDVGNIAISADVTKLKEVEVTAEKSTMDLKVDKKVFNVGKDLSARGGTGLDVMKNIPSVSVDASGNVTLRNNTPQVYIDGRPTTLTLEQIPADQIDRVEVITNPSAKYEAAASGGILNVVLKRNTKPGYNGLVNLGIGTNDQYNTMVMLNLKQKKYGVSLSYNLNAATNRSKGYTYRTNFDSTGTVRSYSNQDLNSTFTRIFQMGRVGFDWYVNNRNTISISENGTFGNFNNEDVYSSNIQGSAHNILSQGPQDNISHNHFFNLTTDINFKHTYPKEGKESILDVQYSYANGGSDFLYATTTYDPTGILLPGASMYQSAVGGQHSHMVTAQWDLALPLRKGMKIETGLRSNYKLTYSFQNVQDSLFSATQYVPDAVLSTNYRIDDLVNAAYGTFTHQIKGFTYQLGMRVEQVYYKGNLVGKDSAFSYQYPSDAASVPKMLFPSINISQKWKDKHELQVNFSRKTNRPNFFQIAPFIFNSDRYNVRRGNPGLQPEFINQAELNYNLTHSKFTWLSSIYGRYVQQTITSYISPIAPGSDINLNTFQNADHSLAGGWENTIKIYAVKKLDITLNGNVFYTSIKGGTAENSINKDGWSWLGKAIVSYKLPMDFTIQANGTYEAPKIQPQGNTMPLYYFDLSLAKDIGFVSFNFTVSDVLNSRNNGMHYVTTDFAQDQLRRRDVRYAKLGVSFKFGKMDASFFKSRKKPQQGGGEDMGF